MTEFELKMNAAMKKPAASGPSVPFEPPPPIAQKIVATSKSAGIPREVFRGDVRYFNK